MPSSDCDSVDFRSWLCKKADAAGLSPLDASMASLLHSEDALIHTLRPLFEYPANATLPNADFSVCSPSSESIYLCGNSLGLMPKATRTLMNNQLDKWAQQGVFGHHSEPLPWAHSDEEALEGVASLVGGRKGEVGLMNGLTVNIHVLMTAFYNPTATRHKILMESRAFPSDHYAIESQIRLKGGKVEESMICLPTREGKETYRTEDIIRYIEEHGDSIAVVFFSGVQYFTGQLFDIEAITKAGHAKGCLVGWDLAHAYANVPLRLHDWDVDFACWCSYKYGSTGAGGLAGLFVNERFKEDKRDRMLGWWSHRMSTRFQMSNVLDLDEGAAGYRISNPPVHLVVPVLGFLEVMKHTTIDALRERSFYLTSYLEYLIDEFFSSSSPHRVSSSISCQSITPRDFKQRGCQLSLKFNVSIDTIYEELIKRGVAVDKRYPYIIRVAPVHLYNTYIDVHRFVEVLTDVVRSLEIAN